MRMTDDDVKKYPKGAQLLKGLEKDLLKQPKILNAWLKACMDYPKDQSEAAARGIALNQALKWGLGPTIDIRPGLIKIPGQDAYACGYQPPFSSGRNYLWITSIWFHAYEFSLADTDRKNNAKRLTTTVLHESVHWVREHAGAFNDIDAQDAGGVFEDLAFGEKACTQEAIFDALASTPR